jgi:g-D-glutamyl-meso-diaminopimelate peptidase
MNKANFGPEQLAKEVRKLANHYPFIETSVIGHSVLGKPLHALRIGEGSFRWHFNGAVHANEWITSLLLLRFLKTYARAYKKEKSIGGKNAVDLFRRTSLWIVPMVNPDGVALVQQGLPQEGADLESIMEWNRGTTLFHRWKANIRGVDLNDQFPAFWEAERDRRRVPGPGPRDYGGTSPLSEPEALALAEWTQHMEFDAVLSLHTQGEEIYYNYRDLEPPYAKQWAHRLALAAGYKAVWIKDSDAGYKDWFIAQFRKPGFTVEAGWGHNPLPLTELEEMTDDIIKLLAEALDLAPAPL